MLDWNRELRYIEATYPDLEPISRVGLIDLLERVGKRYIYEDSPRSGSEQAMDALDKAGSRLIITAKRMREDPEFNPS